MMKTLFIYPEFPETFWSFKYALKFIRKKSAYPPLGLLTVAGLMPSEWPKRLVDVNVDKLTDADLEWADMVFISAMAIQRESAVEIIARAKAAGTIIVGGGPLFTGEPGEFGDVDHLVLNEAELTLAPFLEDLQKGRPKRIYSSDEFCDLDQTPPPLWELVNMKKYASMSIQFSRGCPFNCEFCNVTTLFGHRPRMKTPEAITGELDRLYTAGWKSNIFFVDDNFIGNKRYLKTRLLPAMIEWRKDKKGCVFYTEASINLADDPELMEMMVKAGFDSVFIGIESPDEDSLAECRKTQNKDRDLLSNVHAIQRSGLQVLGGFIVGFDCDTSSIFQRQIDFIQKSGIVTAMVGMLQAPPGTQLFERLEKEGRLLGIMSGDNVDGTTNIVPQMGLEALHEGYRSVMNHIYSPKHYYDRIKVFLREYNPPEARLPFNFQRFLALFRSIVRLGIFGKERFQYWRLLTWTLFRRPRLFSRAVNLSIYGYHFRRICELHIGETSST